MPRSFSIIIISVLLYSILEYSYSGRGISLMLRRTQLITKTIFSPNLPYQTTKMSTFTLPNTEIPVKLVEDLSKEQLLEFPAFKVHTNFSLA
jgi:hypothetical protein